MIDSGIAFPIRFPRCATPQSVQEASALLRGRGNTAGDGEQALLAIGDLWKLRLDDGWRPPLKEGNSTFSWGMVRVSLAALLRGMRCPSDFMQSPPNPHTDHRPGLAAFVLAGNTPLLAWPALCACVLTGIPVFVKMSRHETLWPRLFVQSLEDAGYPDAAARIFLDVWPGNDARTIALTHAADIVIAYGSDQTIAHLRVSTPVETPFYGFGNALSIGFVGTNGTNATEEAAGFACDVLMYGQSGCLSPHTLFVEGNAFRAKAVCAALATALPGAVKSLDVSPVSGPAVARTVRDARDLALFDGYTVRGDDALRWTVIHIPTYQDMPPPVGHGVVFVVPLAHARDLPERLGRARGRISSVGVAGDLPTGVQTALAREGVSRFCMPGEMQVPPLDWKNGNVNLCAVLTGTVVQKK